MHAQRIAQLKQAIYAEAWTILDAEPDLTADDIGRVATRTEQAFEAALKAVFDGEPPPADKTYRVELVRTLPSGNEEVITAERFGRLASEQDAEASGMVHFRELMTLYPDAFLRVLGCDCVGESVCANCIF